MASGKLLVLSGETCRQQDRFRNLDKEYEIEVLLGFRTDTGDVLGMPEAEDAFGEPSPASLAQALQAELGTKIVPYPRFSSKTVNGKPLFMHALEGSLAASSIPTHEETVYRIRLLETRRLNTEELESRIASALSRAPRDLAASKKLGADFRQDAVRQAWRDAFAESADASYMILSLRVTCGSGTYMRSLTERIGAGLGTKGLALSIRRTRIGRYSPFLRLWLRQYR